MPKFEGLPLFNYYPDQMTEYHSVEDARLQIAMHDLRDSGYKYRTMEAHKPNIGAEVDSLSDEQLALAELDTYFMGELVEALADTVRSERARREA